MDDLITENNLSVDVADDEVLLLLADVETAVGNADEVPKLVYVLRITVCVADRRGNLLVDVIEVGMSHIALQVLEFLEERLRREQGDDQEFITAVAVTAKTVDTLQAAGTETDDIIAVAMTVGVIEMLELIDVEDADAEILADDFRQFDAQAVAVRHASERICHAVVAPVLEFLSVEQQGEKHEVQCHSKVCNPYAEHAVYRVEQEKAEIHEDSRFVFLPQFPLIEKDEPHRHEDIEHGFSEDDPVHVLVHVKPFW